MSLNIRIYNISAPNPFRIFYKTGQTLDDYDNGFTQYKSTFPENTEEITISGVTIENNTMYWIKIYDVITDTYFIQNILTHDSSYFSGNTCYMEGFVTCNDCQLDGYVECLTVLPSPSITPTITPSLTITPSITPSITPPNSPTATPTKTPSITPSPSKIATFNYYNVDEYDITCNYISSYCIATTSILNADGFFFYCMTDLSYNNHIFNIVSPTNSSCGPALIVNVNSGGSKNCALIASLCNIS